MTLFFDSLKALRKIAALFLSLTTKDAQQEACLCMLPATFVLKNA